MKTEEEILAQEHYRDMPWWKKTLWNLLGILIFCLIAYSLAS